MKPKETWAVLEEIPQNTPFMMSVAMQFFLQEWPDLGLGDKVTKYFTLFDGDFSKMCFVRKEFEAESDFLSRKMLADPDWSLEVLEKVRIESHKFFREAKRFSKLKFANLSNGEMLKAWLVPLGAHRLSHGIGGSVSWQADVEGERVTKALLSMIERQIKRSKLKLSVPEVFSVLSTPLEESYVKKEEMDLLKLAIKVKSFGNLKKFEHLLEAHAEKYNWLNYQYKGPAYQIDYFRDRLEALLHGYKNAAEKLLKKINREDKELAAKQKKLAGFLHLDSHQKKLIQMAKTIVFIKGLRKDALYHGMYCYEPFFREVGKRFGLSLDQVRAMNYWEIEDVLRGKKVDADELNERLKFCLAWSYRKKYIMYTGRKGRKFLSRIKFEKVDIKNIKELAGTCACPGKARGIVKIVNIPEDMDKMKKGDILVSFNTNPNLMPTIRLASAIVTQSGGLTCHAAIVSRELKIPCVVGVKDVVKVFKDGDKASVDATNGIIKKLK
jgi:phosphohistidine swiveling domain-containing protein